MDPLPPITQPFPTQPLDPPPPPGKDPQRPRRRWLRAAVVPAVVGAGAAIGVIAASGNLGGGSTTTVVRQTVATDASPAATPATPAPSTSGSGSASPSFPSGVGATESVQAIVKNASPGVVLVRSSDGLGTGFLIDGQGHLLTNAHVVGKDSTVSVTFADQTQEQAKVLDADETTDLAVLDVQSTPSSAKALPLGSSGSLVVGDPVVAIGNPLGYERTATTGIVSALQRNICSPDSSVISNAIQTDAAINQGNSGGPLLDGRGRVVGINSQIASQSGGNVGIGFAIPMDTIRPIVQSILNTGSAHHAWIGIQGSELTPATATALGHPGLTGVALTRVDARGPAKSAGLKGASDAGASVPRGADVIVAIDGRTVRSFADVSEAVSSHSVGDTLKVTVQRGAKRLSVALRLADRPSNLQGTCQ